MNIRPCRAADLPEVIRLTLEGFAGIAIDQNVERRLGLGTINGHDWRWRKARQIEEDARIHPAGILIAEVSGRPAGYVTTQEDRDAGKGRIVNLAVAAAARGQGIGRRLIEHALDYFRREGLAFAMIETMENNPVGQRLYPSCGFEEVGRQIHYACKL